MYFGHFNSFGQEHEVSRMLRIILSHCMEGMMEDWLMLTGRYLGEGKQ